MGIITVLMTPYWYSSYFTCSLCLPESESIWVQNPQFYFTLEGTEAWRGDHTVGVQVRFRFNIIIFLKLYFYVIKSTMPWGHGKYKWGMVLIPKNFKSRIPCFWAFPCLKWAQWLDLHYTVSNQKSFEMRSSNVEGYLRELKTVIALGSQKGFNSGDITLIPV